MIAPDTLAQIKERTDIVALVGESVRLVRRGRSFLGLCPFHKEKTPSFHVHPDRGFFHCFGCKESGSAIDFLMKTSGLDFVEAVRLLADRLGIKIEEQSSAQGRAQKSERDELYEVMQLAATFYERSLGLGADRSTAKAVHPLASYAEREIEKRGMPVGAWDTEDGRRLLEVARAFRLGYAPPAWDGLATFLKQQGTSPLVAERAGLLVQGGRGHYDRFRNRLMFAVVDTLGRVVAFSGRALPAPTKEELAKHAPSGPSYDKDEAAKYINSPESPIYTKGEQLFGIHQARAGIRQRGFAVLVEGNFDVVSLHARGIDNVVAPLGTAFTVEQAKLVKRFAPTVVVCFDGDAAGRKATRAARAPCRAGGLDAKVAVLPAGLDPDELVRTKGPQALLALVKNARGLMDHLIQDALDGEGFRGASIAEQVARVRAVAKLLAEEDDPDLRLQAKRFADELSSKLVLRNKAAGDLLQLERTVQAALAGGRGVGRPGPPEGADPAGAGRRASIPRDALGEALLGAILDAPGLLHDPEVQDALDCLEGDIVLAIAAARQFLDDAGGSRPRTEDFLAALPSSIQRFATGRLVSPVLEGLVDAKAELLENSKKLRALHSQRQDSLVRDVLERADSSLDEETEQLLRQVEERARRKRGLQQG